MVERSDKPFDPWHSFHESPEEQRLIKERAKLRQAMKSEYRKRYSNPFKPNQGSLFDPAFQRFFSARVTHAEYYKPTPKMGLAAAAVFSMIGSVMYLTGRVRNKTLKAIEEGEVDYDYRALVAFQK